jgi:hypothetical protein
MKATTKSRSGKSEGAIKSAVNRMRTRYLELLFMHIERTVVDQSDVEEEINFLLDSFR